MYALIVHDSRSRRELLKLPIFACAMDAKRFMQGFKSAMQSDSEMPDEAAPPVFQRGARFAFVWQNYARQWGLDETPAFSVANA